MGRLCFRTGSRLSPEEKYSSVRNGTCFCRHGTNFIEHYACRGTRLIGAEYLSPVTKLVAGTGAVSRYKLSRSQKYVTVHDFNRGQMSVSWCNGHYESVLGAGAKAKSVTNNLPILSVLALDLLFFEFVRSHPLDTSFIKNSILHC